MKVSHISALDGLRGVAVLLVFFGHLASAGMSFIPFVNLQGLGKPGVYLFFVLSAFLLTRQLLKKDASEYQNPKMWVGYALRRTFRVYPLFLLVLLVSLGTTSLLGLYTGGRGFPFTITFSEFWQHVLLQQGKSVLWSIPVEFKYYVLLPFVSIGLVGLRGRWRWSFLATGLAIIITNLLWPGAAAKQESLALGTYLAVFLLGSFSAFLYVDFESKKTNQGSIYLEIVSLIALIALVVTIPSIYSALTAQDIPTDYFHGHIVFFGVLWSIFLLGTLMGRGTLRQLLIWQPLRYIGQISFSLYLWHSAIIQVIKDVVPAPVTWAVPVKGFVAFLIVIAVSGISYMVVEKPTSSYSAKLVSRLEQDSKLMVRKGVGSSQRQSRLS